MKIKSEFFTCRVVSSSVFFFEIIEICDVNFTNSRSKITTSIYLVTTQSFVTITLNLYFLYYPSWLMKDLLPLGTIDDIELKVCLYKV